MIETPGNHFFSGSVLERRLIPGLFVQQPTGIANKSKSCPEIRMRISRGGSKQEAALRGPQRLYLTFPIQQALIKELHQLIGRIILYRPQTHHQGGRTGGEESPPKPQLFISTAAHRQTRFTAA